MALSNDSYNHFDLRTILETSRLLVNPQSPEFILDQLLLILMGRLTSTGGLILMYSPGSNLYHIPNAKGQMAAKKDANLLVDEYYLPTQDPVLTRTEHEDIFTLLNLDSNGVLINMQTGAFHMGFIYLSEKINKEVFAKSELEFAESLSIITSVAVYNSRLLKELNIVNHRLKLKLNDLNTLFEISKEFNLITETDKISEALKSALIDRLKAKTLFFALNHSDETKIIAASGLKTLPDKQELTSLFNLVESVEYIDEKTHSIFSVNNEIQLIVSLYFQGRKAGIVGIGNLLSNAKLSEEDHNFISSMGNLAVLAIQNNILLKERLEAQRIEKELVIAKSIQEGLFPQPVPTIDGFDLAAINIPSYQIGGDYFDIIKTTNNEYLLAIADVTGKGVPAALLMANLQSMLHILIPLKVEMKDAIENINDIIYQNTPSNIFITFFAGLVAQNGNKLKYINAGHNYPMLLKAGENKPRYLTKGGTVLGAVPTSLMDKFEQAEAELGSGDIILFYTDGLTEAVHAKNNEEYGVQRLAECLVEHRDKSSQNIIDAIIENVKEFSDVGRDDDLTIIVLKKH